MILPNGNVLPDPTNAELANAAGASVDPEHSDFDLVIVGSGPAGLSAAVYGASEGFSTLVIDEGGIGGQATSSSLIRNYLGFPGGISGGRLAEQAYEQAWVLGAKFAFMQQALELRREGDRISVSLSGHSGVHARAVILATGASYRRLGIPELEAMNGAGVFYGGPASEAPGMAGHEVYVLGGANSAGQAALHLARFARRVTLVVRAESLAVGHVALSRARGAGDAERRGQARHRGRGRRRRRRLARPPVLRDLASGTEETVPAVGLFLMIGARPHTDWLPAEVSRDGRGFILTGPDLPAPAWPLERSAFGLETSMPGVLAAGDARHGSVKRVASAVGEGSMAIQSLHGLFAADGLERAGPARSPCPSARGWWSACRRRRARSGRRRGPSPRAR